MLSWRRSQRWKIFAKIRPRKKIDNIAPKVCGYITFLADGSTNDGLITDEGTSTQAEDSTIYSKELNIVIFH